MAANFMASCYQAEFRFAIEQTGIVRSIERVIFSAEPEADGNLRAVEELAGEGDHAVHEVSLDEGAADVALASQALRVSGPFTTCASRIAVTGLVGGHAAIGEDEAGHALGRVVMDLVRAMAIAAQNKRGTWTVES